MRRVAIAVRGIVQGVGFRPFVFSAARARELAGWVRNEADTVQIEVQGSPAAVDAFVEALRHEHPPQARIDAVEVHELPNDAGAPSSFEIRPSTGQAAPQPTIPADLATCAECLAEIRDPAQRRYGYPFTNCTNCGPRWSIIEALPYDRPRTSMAGFAMCPDCRAEYENPADRRFHAQPIACPRCGPTLQLLDPLGRPLAAGPDALAAAARTLREGGIVALKGLGGFQLLVDATDPAAVARLRERKRRPHRPFAVMMPSLDEVRRCCLLSVNEADALQSPQAPIMLLRRVRDTHPPSPKGRGSFIVDAVAPGNPYLGVMLPYTPLHHLLMAVVRRPLVCTSGNLSEEPMAITTEDALRRLGPIADVLLTHDRPIVRPVDDSVARVGPDGLQVLRRARGFAPLPIGLSIAVPTILAVGGHLKDTVAISLGRVRETHPSESQGDNGLQTALTPALSRRERETEATLTSTLSQREREKTHATPVVLSSHLGDLDNVLSVEVFQRAIDDLADFYQARPEAVVCDLHPDYASTRHAEALTARWDVPLLRVQHHHAHAAACMAEHELEGPVLGLTWDGTGYGSDGTVWGGEALICEGGTFTRAAHLRTFPLPGGDRAVREPRRSALGLLFEVLKDDAAAYVEKWFRPAELKTLLAALGRGLHAPRTSSVGRLFDAVAALCGLGEVCTFEGQAAMALEFAADTGHLAAYPLPLSKASPAVADWEPLVRAVLADRAAGVHVGKISARFHNALAGLAVAVAQSSGYSQVVLSGGCFQNAILAERVRSRLLQAGLNVYTHRSVPLGDGGIALGQIYVAARQLSSDHSQNL